MAQRLAFFTTRDFSVCSKMFEFEWMQGLSAAQKKRSIKNLHKAIDNKALEVSTKSEDALGVSLSAFNLKLDGIPLECVFQSSKKFAKGGPYRDLLNADPKDAKRDERLKQSGDLLGFDYDGFFWNLKTGTAFYDYIYVKAVKNSFSKNKIREVMDYEYFTDIEFNHNKSYNTQARSVALVKALIGIYGEIPEITSPQEFLKLHKTIVKN